MKPALAPAHVSPVFPDDAPLRVGLLGIGTVGGGTCRVLKRNRQLIGARAGRAIELRALSTRTLNSRQLRRGAAAARDWCRGPTRSEHGKK